MYFCTPKIMKLIPRGQEDKIILLNIIYNIALDKINKILYLPFASSIGKKNFW